VKFVIIIRLKIEEFKSIYYSSRVFHFNASMNWEKFQSIFTKESRFNIFFLRTALVDGFFFDLTLL